MNTMTVDGFNAKIEYDEELDLFRGEILGLNGGADFYGKNPKELRTEFKKSLQVFLDVCKEKGIDPDSERGRKLLYGMSTQIMEMIRYDGPVIFDCLVEKHENCFPMIPSGKPHNEMLLGDADTQGVIGAKGAVLV